MSQKALLRVGIIGIGFGQQVHLPAFRANPYCEVVAICASSQERAAAVAARHQISAAYGSWQKLIESPDIDVVSIATPPQLQAIILRACLDNGKPAFCEKPLAGNAEQARILAQSAQGKQIPCMVDLEFC